MKKSSLFLIMMLGLSGLMVLTFAPVTTQAQNETIVIGVVEGSNAFNVTDITVDKGATYTIVFHNNDPFASHNLRIDINDNLEDNDDVNDNADTLIGVANTDTAGGEGGPDAIWMEDVTFGDEDSEILFYCGFQGHYAAGMEGTITIGEGDSGFIPGFGLFAGLAALLFVGLAIPQLRRRN